MSDITTGIIYKIICKLDHKFCYIGSTFDSLRNRWQRHKGHYRDWIKDSESMRPCSCVRYFKKYGIENFKIIEIIKYDIHLKDRKCLEAYETLWIRKTKGCCNVILPVQYLKREYQKQYREDNKTEISEKKRQYNQDNQESIAEKRRQYRQDNNTELSQKSKVKLTCQCGVVVTKSNMARHCKSAKHQNYLTAQTE